MTGKGILDKLRRKKQEPEPEPKYRKQGEIAIDISGLDRKSQINIARALAEEGKKDIRQDNRSTETSVMVNKKRKLINLNYPPPGMSQEEIAGFWGELTPEQLKESEEADRRAKERIRTEHRTRASYGY
jgi:hypothetical protein